VKQRTVTKTGWIVGVAVMAVLTLVMLAVDVVLIVL
jgi:hypothetical protein